MIHKGPALLLFHDIALSLFICHHQCLFSMNGIKFQIYWKLVTRVNLNVHLGSIAVLSVLVWCSLQFSLPRAPSQYPKRRLSVRSRKVSKPRDCRIALKFDRHIGSNAAEVPVKFQSDRTILNTNLAASRLYEILRKDVFSDIETGPRFLICWVCVPHMRLCIPIWSRVCHRSPKTLIVAWVSRFRCRD